MIGGCARYTVCGVGYKADGIVFVGNFKKLKVWERAKNLAVYIYSMTMDGSFVSDRVP